MSNKNFDSCVSFHINNGAFLGRIVRLNNVLDQILGKHCYPLDVSAALAETTALATLLSSLLKYEGLFTLQIQGNGPVSLLVADVTSEGKIRACSTYDAEKLASAKALRKTENQIEALPHLVGGGYMAFTVDQGQNTQPYQGVVDLQGKTLTEMALRYFKQSEQIDTTLKLFLKHPEGESDSWLSAGILLQKAPLKGGKTIQESPEDLAQAWEDAEAYIQSLTDNEIFDEGLTSADILYRLFHANNLTLDDEKSYSFRCRCSRDKLLNTIRGFKEDEIESMFEEGKITLTCHFCSEKYVFDKSELSKH